MCPLHHAALSPSIKAHCFYFSEAPPGPLHGATWASLTAGRLWQYALYGQLPASSRPDPRGGLLDTVDTAALPPCQQLASVAAQAAQLAVRCVEGRVAQGGTTCRASLICACLEMERCLDRLQQVLPRRNRGARGSGELAAAANAQHLAVPPLPAVTEAVSWMLRMHVLMQLAAPPQSSEESSDKNGNGDAERSTGQQRPRRQQRQTAAALASISFGSASSAVHHHVMSSVRALAFAVSDESAGEPCCPCKCYRAGWCSSIVRAWGSAPLWAAIRRVQPSYN